MKLRIQGNSLRLRLTRNEVAELHDTGRIESSIEFGSGSALTYALEGSPLATTLTANFDGRSILVTLPATLIQEWALSDRVAIEGPLQAGVQLLIEKDFQCLHKPEQRDPNAYPHPLAT